MHLPAQRRPGWLAGLALLVSLSPSPLAAEAIGHTPAQQLTAAIEAWRSGDLALVKAELKRHGDTLDGDPAIWLLRAQLAKREQRLDEALAHFEQHLQLAPAASSTLYAMAAVHALKGNADTAIAWLQRAADSRREDLSGLPYDSDFASLHADPRLQALLPWAERFEQPFVERVKVLREWRGEGVNHQFGWIARAVGDVNGDGSVDIVTSAPTHSAGGEGAGRVYVYSVRTGSLLWQVDGTAGDALGTGIEAAGDSNGDGIPDVVACGPGGPHGGHALLLSGRDGQRLQRFEAEAPGDAFGTHCEGVGDVDGDGHADVIVGAPTNDAGGVDAGRAYVFSGKTGKRVQTLTGNQAGGRFGAAVTGRADDRQRILAVGAPGVTGGGRVYVFRDGADRPSFESAPDAEQGRALGAMFVSIPGDLDGDGHFDVYGSDWSHAARGAGTGRVHAWSGATGKTLLILTGEAAGEGFGTTQGVAGDVDGDGHDDLVVGSWQYRAHATGAGRVIVYSGHTGLPLSTLTSRIPGDTFGFDAVGIGDVDGDGQVDLLVTAAWSGVNGFHSGRVFVLASGVPRPQATPAR